VTLDLGQLESCDAAGVDLLVTLTRRAHSASGDLLLQFVPENIHAAFSAADASQELRVVPPPGITGRQLSEPRYLFRAGESVPFAYASSRYDYSLVSDGRLWAHTSHDWLLAAGSGAVLAHRTRGAYFSPDTAECLYCERPSESTT
jgi:hypothetical protein